MPKRPSRPLGTATPPGELGTLLGQARRVVWAALGARLSAHGVAAHTFQLLSRLDKLGPSTQVQLAEATAQHPAAISRLLDEVERAGLVRRVRSREDRRKQTVALTARGKAQVAALRPEVHRAVEEAVSPLSATEQAQLARLLHKLIGAASEPSPSQRGLPRSPRSP